MKGWCLAKSAAAAVVKKKHIYVHIKTTRSAKINRSWHTFYPTFVSNWFLHTYLPSQVPCSSLGFINAIPRPRRKNSEVLHRPQAWRPLFCRFPLQLNILSSNTATKSNWINFDIGSNTQTSAISNLRQDVLYSMMKLYPTTSPATSAQLSTA